MPIGTNLRERSVNWPARSAVALALWILALCVPFVAAQAQEVRVALVIGNSVYGSVGRLNNPAPDAAAVAKAMRESGFRTVQVENDLGRDGMLAALRRFEALADASDWALVYYAGHGIEVGGMNYLVPVDARLHSDRDVEDETVSLQQVQKRLEGARKLRLVILDACRNNPFATAMRRTSAARSIGQGLAKPEITQPGSLIAFAAGAGQLAADGAGGQANSPYVAALVHRLAEPDVEVNLFFRRVRADVLQATGQTQEPATYESLPPDRFVFRPSQTAALPSPLPPVQPIPPSALDRVALIEVCDRLAAAPSDLDRPSGVKGVGVPEIDAPSAVAACRAAIEAAPDDRRIAFQLGRALFKAGAIEEARSWYEKAARAGNATAMNNLGNLYANGLGVPRDGAAARAWFEKAASAGETTAMTNLGAMYVEGRDVPKDFSQAREWLEKAAAAGDGGAMRNLGILYSKGLGVAKDLAAARAWYEKAAASGQAAAARNLGVMYAKGEGVALDLVTARRWYERAAAGGDAPAMRYLGVLYDKGRGVRQDAAAAYGWYQRAGEAGDPAAMTNVGTALVEGRGVARDEARARSWYERAARAGDAASMYNLGVLYAKGQGVAKDEALARIWFAKADAAGHPDARRGLETLDRRR